MIPGILRPNLETIHQTLAIIPAGFNEFILGIAYGWTAPTLHKLTVAGSGIPLTMRQCSWVGSLMELGGIFGPLISALLLDTLGRKVLLSSCTLTFFVACLLILFYENVWAIYLMRLLFGIALGVSDSSSSIYVAEVSSAKVRGVFCSVTTVAFFSGGLFELIVGSYLSFNVVAIVNASICFFALMSTVWLVESPYFLITKGNLKKARENYLWLKGTKKWENVNLEFEQIHHSLQNKTKKQPYDEILRDKATRRSIIIVLTLASCTWTTGILALTAFTFKIFSRSDTMSTNEFTILLGVMQFASAIGALLVIERFNRRTLLLTCYALSAVSNSASAVLYFVHQRVTPIGGFSWFIFGSTSLCVGVFSLMYSVLCTIRGELFPQNIKAIGGSVSIVVEELTAFLVANIFLQVADLFGIYVNFLFYFLISVFAFVFVYFKLPETRGRTLMDIQKSLAS